MIQKSENHLLLRLLWGILAVVQSAPAQPAPATRAVTLRDAASEHFLIGAAISISDLTYPARARLVAQQFNSITAGNEFKPDALQLEKGKFTFEHADAIADFAARHDMKLIGHTLLWHQQAPRWLFVDENNKPLPRHDALENLRTHIETVVKRYRGKVLGWDVVNEALADDPKEYLRDTPARRAIGDDYIIKAFEFAHAADPSVELYYNDYNIEADYKRAKALRLIRELQAAGCRLDAVGIQGHWLLDRPELDEIERGITELSGCGVKLMITELDVDVLPRKAAGADLAAIDSEAADPFKRGLGDEMQLKLARRYKDLFALLMRHRRVITRVTLWGFYDGGTWLNDWPVKGRTNHPLLWDRELRAKPAYEAVIESLRSSSTSQ